MGDHRDCRVVLLQAVLIAGLLYYRRRRHAAEIEVRQRMAELAHMNRQATAGQLSASIAHELNQPLGAILNNVMAASIIVDRPSPDLKELKAILSDIQRDDQRASDIIKRLRRTWWLMPISSSTGWRSSCSVSTGQDTS